MRIAIFGHFGGDELFTDGQSVKVKSLYEGLSYHYPSVKIDKIDTYYLKKNPFKLFLSFVVSLCIDKKIVFFPAARGRKVLFSLFYYISIVLRKEVYHDCIAGSLDKEIELHPQWVKYLNRYKINWMESREQVERLKHLGINNVEYMPNFKHIMPVEIEDIKTMVYSAPYRFCTFSRVEKKKGIEDALRVIKEININYGGKATLDVYGPIQSGQEEWFKEVCITYSDIMKYCGVVDPHDSVAVLKDYFALLFPTQYFTEGMPGTIIDAMFAGVPVIARRWAWCDNMIQTGYNGISYEFDAPNELYNIIMRILDKPDIIISMKENCIKESVKYSEPEIIKRIVEKMDLK